MYSGGRKKSHHRNFDEETLIACLPGRHTLSQQLAYGYGLDRHIPAEVVVDGGSGADPIVVDAGRSVSVARGAGGESSAPNCVRFGPVLRG